MKIFARVSALLLIPLLTAEAKAQLFNIDLDVNSSDQFSGAAVLGTSSSQWNYVNRVLPPNIVPLIDDTGVMTSTTLSFNRIVSGTHPVTGNFVNLGFSYIGTGPVTFAGLTPGSLYDLVIYSAKLTDFSVNGSTQSVTGTTDWSNLTQGVNYARFLTSADSSGNLTFQTGQIRQSIGEQTWSGIQLQKSTASVAVTPELPGVALLLPALLPVALVGRNRRRKQH